MSNFTTTDPCCYENEIWHKIGCNSACIRDIFEILAHSRGIFGVGVLNDIRQILPRSSPVATATKFQTKSAIVSLSENSEISPRSLHLTAWFRDKASELCQSNFTMTDRSCHGNEIWDKIVHNSAYVGNIAEILAPSGGGEFKVGLLNDVRQIPHDRPLLPRQRNLRQNRL